MLSVNNRIARTSEKMKQLEHQKIIQENREREAKCKTELRRQIIIGEMFIRHFPIAMEFIPHNTTAENSIEFAPLEDFIAALADCQNLLQKLESEMSS